MHRSYLPLANPTSIKLLEAPEFTSASWVKFISGAIGPRNGVRPAGVENNCSWPPGYVWGRKGDLIGGLNSEVTSSCKPSNGAGYNHFPRSTQSLDSRGHSMVKCLRGAGPEPVP